ncbi:MAG: flagellar protein FlaG [Nitrospirae bacterium]|nr:MAG: flagellar protein FlaG [Nitrospirota bacterium]
MSNDLHPVVNGAGGLLTASAPDRTSTHPAPASSPVAATSGGSAAVEDAIREANRALAAASTSFRFAHDDETNQIVVSVLDENTGKVIRQVPSPEQLSIAARLRAVAGLFLNQRV